MLSGLLSFHSFSLPLSLFSFSFSYFNDVLRSVYCCSEYAEFWKWMKKAIKYILNKYYIYLWWWMALLTPHMSKYYYWNFYRKRPVAVADCGYMVNKRYIYSYIRFIIIRMKMIPIFRDLVVTWGQDSWNKDDYHNIFSTGPLEWRCVNDLLVFPLFFFLACCNL